MSTCSIWQHLLKSVSLLHSVQETWQCGSSLPEVSQLQNKSLHFPTKETIKHFCTPKSKLALSPHNLSAQKSSLEPTAKVSVNLLANKSLESPTRRFVSRKVTCLLQTLSLQLIATWVTFNVAIHQLVNCQDPIVFSHFVKNISRSILSLQCKHNFNLGRHPVL